jgi:hypothetical protein
MNDRDHNGRPSYPIPVWNGIFDHRAKIGEAIWVFLWCIDRVTKEQSGVGFVLGGSVVTAGKIADELGYSDRTIRQHLHSLAGHGYITMKLAAHGFIITVAKSQKFNIWKTDKSAGQVGRELPTTGDAQVGRMLPTTSEEDFRPLTKNFRRTKEDTAVDSAGDSAQTQTPPLPLPKIGRGVNIWQAVLLELKDDFGTAYVSNKRFQEDQFEKYFRDSWLVAIEDGTAVLDGLHPQNLRDGVEKFHRRLLDTFRGVAGFEVEFQVLAHKNSASPRGVADIPAVETPGSECA